MLGTLVAGSILLADRAYDSDKRREQAKAVGAWANIKPVSRRIVKPIFSAFLYASRQLGSV